MMEQEFYGESDRAVVILSATLAELSIEVAIRRMLRDDRSTEDLFDLEVPSEAFRAKSNLVSRSMTKCCVGAQAEAGIARAVFVINSTPRIILGLGAAADCGCINENSPTQ